MFGYTIIRTSELECYDAQWSEMRDILDAEEYSGVPNLTDKIRLALKRLEDFRQYNHRKRMRILALEAELDHWRAHGQLRDPKTGRLIPKAKAAA